MVQPILYYFRGRRFKSSFSFCVYMCVYPCSVMFTVGQKAARYYVRLHIVC